MADEGKERFRARIEALLEQGKTEDEIRAMAPQLRAEAQAPPGISRGPAPQTMEERVAATTAKAPPMDLLDALGQRGQGTKDAVNAFGGSMWDKATMGIWPAITDAVGLTTREGRQAQEEQHPTASGLGKGTGYGLSAVAGPARAVGTAGAALVRKAAPALAAQAQGRLGVAAGTGAALGYAEGGTAEDAAAGGLAGLVGQGVLGEAIPAAASLARRGIQKFSPRVGQYAQAKEAGRLPAAKALPKGQEGITRASERARDEILAADEGLTAEAQAAYQARVQPELEKPGALAPVRRQTLETGVGSRPPGAKSNTTADKRPATKVVAQVRKALDDLGPNPTVGDMLHVRRALDEAAGFGSPDPSSSQMAAREVRSAVRQGVREASPAVAAADDEFTQFRRGQERRNDILFRREDGGRTVQLSDEALEAMPAGMRSAMRVGDEVKAAAFLERMGDDSVEAVRLAPYFDELAEQSPAFAEALKQLEAKKALEATRLLTTQPQTRTNLAKAVTTLPGIGPMAGGSVNLLSQYGRGGLRLLDQSLRAPQALRGSSAPGRIAPFDPYRLKLEQALEARKERR